MKATTYGSFIPRFHAPVRVGIEATGSMQWFVNLMEELGIEYQVGHPAKIRAAEPRKQKHDRRDADLILKLLVENRFPAIWLPSRELRDLRALLWHRHQWVRIWLAKVRDRESLSTIGKKMYPRAWDKRTGKRGNQLPISRIRNAITRVEKFFNRMKRDSLIRRDGRARSTSASTYCYRDESPCTGLRGHDI